MQPKKEGGFCNFYSETVINFTKMIHNEVANYVNNKRLQNIFGKSINVQLNSGCTEALCYIITRTFQTNWKIIKKNVAAILLCVGFAQITQAQAAKDIIVVQSDCHSLGRGVTKSVSTATGKSKKSFPTRDIPVIATEKIKIATISPAIKKSRIARQKGVFNSSKNDQ